ncbi:MAG: GAF domain-containing sensor histidine kinase [bacterium]|nr:GAF domain-containing sensor histidine kinase [bacterium]
MRSTFKHLLFKDFDPFIFMMSIVILDGILIFKYFTSFYLIYLIGFSVTTAGIAVNLIKISNKKFQNKEQDPLIILNFFSELINCHSKKEFESVLCSKLCKLNLIISAIIFLKSPNSINYLSEVKNSFNSGVLQIEKQKYILILSEIPKDYLIILSQDHLKYFQDQYFNPGNSILLIKLFLPELDSQKYIALEINSRDYFMNKNISEILILVQIYNEYLRRFLNFHDAIENTIRLSYFVEINKLINSSLNWSVIVKNILLYLCKLLNCDVSMLFLFNDSDNNLILEDISGKNINRSNKLEVQGTLKINVTSIFQNSPYGLVKFDDISLLSNDFKNIITKLGLKNISNIIIAPLKIKDKFIGVLAAVNNGNQTKIKDENLELIQNFSQIVSISLSNASAFRNFRREFSKVLRHTSEVKTRRDALESIFESIKDGIIVTNNIGNIIEINSTALEMLSLRNKKQVVNRNFENILKPYLARNSYNNPEDRSNIICNSNSPVEFKIGDHFYLINIGLISEEDSIDSGTVIVFEDVSRYKKIEELKTEFISSLSHELKTPLTCIIGSVKILNKKFSENPESDIYKLIEILDCESKNLLSQIDKILQLSRFEVKKENLNIEEFNPGEVAERIENTFKDKFQEKNIQYYLHLQTNLFTGDKEKIFQVISNLISNSIKYNKVGGSVNLTIKKDLNSQIIEVSDSGIGIKDDNINRLFEPFYRIEDKHHEIPGTGLGLSICKKIIDLHKGKIEVFSKLNLGTKFICSFPKIYEG